MTAAPRFSTVTAPACLAQRGHTISALRANAFSILLLVVACPAALVAHSRIWDEPIVEILSPLDAPIWVVLAVTLAGVIVHELLHGAAFVLLGQVPLRSLRFGVSWGMGAACAGTTSSLTVAAYRGAAALPGLVLGVAPLLAGLAMRSPALLLFGVLMIAGAGGDAAILLAIRRLPADALVQDAPDRIGCVEVPTDVAATPGSHDGRLPGRRGGTAP